jgi:quercetin dioxygenase-like cupin family protein
MGVVHRRRPDGSWDGVPPRPYGEGMQRHELIGLGDGAEHYRVRYFEVPAGRTTTLEQHEHDHGVVIERGRARVTLGDEPLGFICVAPPGRRGADPEQGRRPGGGPDGD